MSNKYIVRAARTIRNGIGHFKAPDGYVRPIITRKEFCALVIPTSALGAALLGIHEMTDLEIAKTQDALDELNKTSSEKGVTDITIEFSFLGITIRFTGASINPSVLKSVLGIIIYLLVVTRVLSDYNNFIQKKKSSSRALEEAEIQFNKQIDALYELSGKSSVGEANLIVFDEGKVDEYNVFEKQLSVIRESIIDLQNKYGDKIHAPLAKALNDLYNSTILNPADISKMKMLVDEIRRVGKLSKRIRYGSIKLLEEVMKQLSNLEKSP